MYSIAGEHFSLFIYFQTFRHSNGEPRSVESCSIVSRPALGPTQPLIQWDVGSFPGIKQPGREVDHSPPTSAEVKGVELYLHSPNTSSWRGA
jgi:hypothetical protein